MRKSAIFKALVIGASLIIPVERVEAQVSYDQVTATVTDPDGHLLANAPFSWVLVDSLGNRVSSATTPNGQIYNAAAVRGNLSNAGVMSVQLVPNGILTKPSNTHWQLSITPPLPVDQSNILTYQPPWNLTYTTTISAPVDLSTQISAQTSIVNYFNTQTGQSTLTGWLVGTSDPPSLPCSAGLHAGYLYMASDNAAFQCNNAVGGVYQWNLFVGSSTAGVSKIIPGTNVTCSPNVSGSCQGNVTLNATASSTTVNVNGSPVSDPNFNGSTPAAGSNGKNIAFQVSGSNVSGEVVGDGNAVHYLDGTGSYSTPAGTGTLTSIQSQTGPAITLQSTGATVAITTPSSNVINLEATATASGVQYNPANTLYLWAGPDSIVGDDGGAFNYGSAIPMTGWSRSGTVCTFISTGAHGLVANEWFSTDQVGGWPVVTSPYAPWTSGRDLFQVASVTSSTQWTANCPLISATSGSGGNAENANFFLPFNTASLPFFSGHGATATALPVGSTIVSMAANYSTVLHPLVVANSPNPTFVIITGGRNDIQACTSVATLEADLKSVWASIHADGGQVVEATITPNAWNTSNGSCPSALTSMSALNEWLKGQAKTNANLASGQYVDRVVDVFSTVGDSQNPALYLTSGNGGLSAGGISRIANLINEEMSTQGSGERGYPSMIIPAPWGGSLAATADGYAWHPPFVDSIHAFSIWNHAGTAELMRWDTSSPHVYSQQIAADGGGGCTLTDASTGFMHTTGAACGGGTTTNALTMNNGGSGAASGATFDGSAAKTISYNSIGAAPTVSPTFTGTPDASGATQFKLPVAAGYTSAAQGQFGYDSTNLNWHGWQNGADNFLAVFPVATPPTSGDCAEFSKIGNSWKLIDAGGACGVSGGGVTAFSGDGTLLSNSASTGSVTATLANAAAHKFWGNNTGSTAAPGYESITAADLVGIRQWSCQPGIGDGLNAITAGTYLQSTCKNTTGVTVTLTGLSCFTDNSGSSTMNAAGNTLGALLTGAVTCTSSFAAGTQSANVALTNGDYVKFTFVADGTSKQATWVVTGTY